MLNGAVRETLGGKLVDHEPRSLVVPRGRNKTICVDVLNGSCLKVRLVEVTIRVG